MNYRKLRIIILALTVPVVFVVVGVLKAVVRYFFLFLCFFFIFISFAYAEVPSGGWATSIIRVQTPALCCPTTVTKTPSPVGSVVCRYTCANSEPGCFADTCTFVEYTTGGSSSYAYAGCNYAKPVDDISLCSDALKSAYYGGSAPSDFSCPAGKDSVGGCNGTPKYCEGSDTYNQAMRFLAFISGMKSFSFENWIGSNGISYICVNTAILTSGRSMLYINSPAGQEPSFSTNNACVTQSAYNAANNTVCDTSGTTALNGKNTNIHKSVGSTGLTTICKDANGVYINCPGSVSTAMGGGITITQDPTGVGPTTITSPTGGTNPDGTSITKTEPVTTSGTGAGVTIGGLNTGNCYDGIKNGDEISIDKGGRCVGLTSPPVPSIPLPDITKTGSGTVGGGQYTGGDGSGKSAFESSAISDNSELKGLFSKFMNDMKASSFFSMPRSLFYSFPSGGSPDITFSAGRFGTHTYNFSSAWASIIPILKGIVIVAFVAASIKIIAIKGGSG